MSLLAIKILKKNRDFLLNAISYYTQNGALGRANYLQNNLSKHNEAIKELEEYEQNFKQKSLNIELNVKMFYQLED